MGHESIDSWEASYTWLFTSRGRRQVTEIRFRDGFSFGEWRNGRILSYFITIVLGELVLSPFRVLWVVLELVFERCVVDSFTLVESITDQFRIALMYQCTI